MITAIEFLTQITPQNAVSCLHLRKLNFTKMHLWSPTNIVNTNPGWVLLNQFPPSRYFTVLIIVKRLVTYWILLSYLQIRWHPKMIRKIAGCTCAGNAETFSTPLTSKETTSYRPQHTSRHVILYPDFSYMTVNKSLWKINTLLHVITVFDIDWNSSYSFFHHPRTNICPASTYFTKTIWYLIMQTFVASLMYTTWSEKKGGVPLAILNTGVTCVSRRPKSPTNRLRFQ